MWMSRTERAGPECGTARAGEGQERFQTRSACDFGWTDLGAIWRLPSVCKKRTPVGCTGNRFLEKRLTELCFLGFCSSILLEEVLWRLSVGYKNKHFFRATVRKASVFANGYFRQCTWSWPDVAIWTRVWRNLQQRSMRDLEIMNGVHMEKQALPCEVTGKASNPCEGGSNSKHFVWRSVRSRALRVKFICLRQHASAVKLAKVNFTTATLLELKEERVKVAAERVVESSRTRSRKQQST